MRQTTTTRIIEIGRCIGCNQRARLDAGVCLTCLEDPNRGRRWAEIAQRVRRDPAFAATVYSHIKTDGGRRIFLGMFGAEVMLPKAHDRDEGREGSGA
jgi:hypothetical protein